MKVKLVLIHWKKKNWKVEQHEKMWVYSEIFYQRFGHAEDQIYGASLQRKEGWKKKKEKSQSGFTKFQN